MGGRDLGSWPPEDDSKAAAHMLHMGNASFKPLDLKHEMATCHGDDPAAQWWDFVPGTYDMLAHNCNSFSYQALKRIGLPTVGHDSLERIMAGYAPENKQLNPIKGWLATLLFGAGRGSSGASKSPAWVSRKCE